MWMNRIPDHEILQCFQCGSELLVFVFGVGSTIPINLCGVSRVYSVFNEGEIVLIWPFLFLSLSAFADLVQIIANSLIGPCVLKCC